MSRIANRDLTRPEHVESIDQMLSRAAYYPNGTDPRWPELFLEDLERVPGRGPAVAVANVNMPEHRQRLLGVALCTDGADYWAALPPGFQPADTTTELGYQASIVLQFLRELGVYE